MEIRELRIGNYVEYRIQDELDERKEWWELSIIDSSDLQILESGIDDDYRAIPLTEEWLLKFGFEKYDWFDGCFIKCNNKHLMIQFYEPKQEILIYFTKISKDKDGHKMNGRDYLFKVKKYYVHQLQNLFFSLTGEELILKNK